MANQEMEFHSVCCQSQTCTGLCASGLFSPPLNCVIEVVQEVFLRCFEIVKTIYVIKHLLCVHLSSGL